jgi:ribosomal protein S18 acetylase RimI-like enzyme
MRLCDSARVAEHESPAFTIRPPRADERGALLALHMQAFRPVVEAVWGAWHDAEDDFETLVHGGAQVIDVAGEPAGLLRVVREPHAITLDRIAVGAGWRGRGLGTAVVRRLQLEARERGCPLRLSVYRANPALELYRRLGFEIEREHPPRVVMRWTP